MNNPIILFIVAFAMGAAVALGVRSALHRPYDVPGAPPAASHAASPAANMAVAPAANTICPVCGMAVDASLPTAQYDGKTVGFGCDACPAKFAADPQHYGPFALQNRKAD